MPCTCLGVIPIVMSQAAAAAFLIFGISLGIPFNQGLTNLSHSRIVFSSKSGYTEEGTGEASS